MNKFIPGKQHAVEIPGSLKVTDLITIKALNTFTTDRMKFHHL
jgi:hypothetical protein